LDKYKNLKLSTKLIISFLIMAALATAIGVVGITGMATLSQRGTEMYEENTKPMGNLAVMYDTLASQRICANNMVIFHTADPAFAQAEAASLAEKEALFDESFIAYSNHVSAGREQELFDAINQGYYNEFASAKNAVKEAVVSGDATSMASAIKVMDDQGAEISGYMDEAFTINDEDASALEQSNTSLYTSRLILLLIVMAVGVIISISFGLFLASLISKPINRILTATRQVGEYGDFHFSENMISEIKNDAQAQDEIGQMAFSFSRMMDGIIAKTKVLTTVASGDLTPNPMLVSERDTIGNALQQMLDSLNHMFGEINTATDQVATGSNQIATGAQTLAQATTEQASTVENLSQSLSEVADRTKNNAERAEQAAILANTIKDNAEQGSRQMKRMIEAVNQINEASKAISSVIKAIDDIAFQTNILSLNAAVEAARAGTHGKGFAVVAEEVRNLASRSADAAKDTEQLIADSVEKAELGVQIAQETSEALSGIVSGIGESSQIVSDIARSSEDQRKAISEVNRGIDQVTEVVQQNSATAEESAAASEEMSGQSDMLRSLVSKFRLRKS